MQDETNNTIFKKLFKETIVQPNPYNLDDGRVISLHTDYLTKRWFENLKLVFMYDEKKADGSNVNFNACNSAIEPGDVDTRRTLYYAKVIETAGSNQMELLSKKGFKTDDFVKVRSLVEGLRTAAADLTDANAAVIAYLSIKNKEFDDIIKDMEDLTPNNILGGKKNKSSKQRKQKKNKSSRKH